MTTTNDLIIIETLKPAEVFKPGAVKELLDDLEQKVRAIPAADHTTEKGRNAIKALAFKVTRSKTALDEMGKNFVAELKKAAGVVDADRRIIRERLEALKDEVRKPVTEYEEQEEIRIDAHKNNMEKLQLLDTFVVGTETLDEINARLLTLEALRSLAWEEFSDGANRLIARMETSLSALRAKIIKQEEEQAELERLRKADADRQEAQRKAAIELERQERDKMIAEKAVRETEERNAAVGAAAERDRLAAIARAEKAEADAKAVVKIAADHAEFEKAAAVEAEQRRVAQAKAAEEAENQKRMADTAHRKRINNVALADLMKVSGITDKLAKAVIVAIASGKVSGIKVQY